MLSAVTPTSPRVTRSSCGGRPSAGGGVAAPSVRALPSGPVAGTESTYTCTLPRKAIWSAVVASFGPVSLRTVRLKPSMVMLSAEIFSTGIRLPSASGTGTTLTPFRPENDSDRLPSWAGGWVKTGAPASGRAGAGGAVGAGVAPGADGVPDAPG